MAHYLTMVNYLLQENVVDDYVSGSNFNSCSKYIKVSAKLHDFEV